MVGLAHDNSWYGFFSLSFFLQSHSNPLRALLLVHDSPTVTMCMCSSGGNPAAVGVDAFHHQASALVLLSVAGYMQRHPPPALSCDTSHVLSTRSLCSALNACAGAAVAGGAERAAALQEHAEQAAWPHAPVPQGAPRQRPHGKPLLLLEQQRVLESQRWGLLVPRTAGVHSPEALGHHVVVYTHAVLLLQCCCSCC